MGQPPHNALLSLGSHCTSPKNINIISGQFWPSEIKINQNTKIPVGGRLQHFQKFWVQNDRDKWAKQVVSKGYAIEFLSRPSLQENPIWTILPKEQHPLLWEEINQMLEKEAIMEIKTKSKGFYSTFFLVPKPDGSQRSILNLKPLNKFLKVQKFKMCTPQIIILTLRQGDWLASIDLKDAYYQIPILESHRPFLRFASSGTDLSVQCPAFWNINGSKSFYQGLGTYSRDSSRERCSNVPLSRRLFTGSQISQSVTMGSPTDSGRPRSGRFSDKHKEISPMPSPEASISRCRVRYPSSHILCTERSCLGAEANSSGLYETRFQKNCKTVSSPVRFNGRSNSYDSLGQIENETYSNVSKQSMEGCISTPRVLFTDSPMVDNTYSLVGRLYESDPGFEMEEDISHKSVNYRRKSGRLGRSFTFKKSSRSLEALPTTPTHKCSRITGSVQFPEIVPAQGQGSNSPSPNRQYDSSPLHKQIRRYQIFKTVQFNNESDRMVHKEQNRSDSDTHPRYSQHTGRYAVEKDLSLSRMGVSRQSSKTALSDLEYSSDRSFCNFRKQR